MIKPDKLDSGTTLKGLDYIDVPGNSRRDYKLTYYAHKEGQSQFKVRNNYNNLQHIANIEYELCIVKMYTNSLDRVRN